MDTVALQSRKNGYSLFMASWLSWKCPMPKLGKTKDCKLYYTPILLTYVILLLYSYSFKKDFNYEVLNSYGKSEVCNIQIN